MLGVIFKLLEEYVYYKKGRSGVDALYSNALINRDLIHEEICYPDEMFLKFFVNAASILNVTPEELQYSSGRFTMRKLTGMYKGIFQSNPDMRSFVRSIPAIHTSFPTLKPGKKWISVSEDGDAYVLNYVSPNKLKDFLIGLIDEAFKVYGVQGHTEELPSDGDIMRVKVCFDKV